MKCEPVVIITPFIRLDALLKFCGAAQTGGHAKDIISRGEVLLDGQVCTQRGRKIYPNMTVCLAGVCYEVRVE